MTCGKRVASGQVSGIEPNWGFIETTAEDWHLKDGPEVDKTGS
jgi:hypothetical protein